MNRATPSVSTGIFRHDLTITLRIIMQEVLDAHVYRMLRNARKAQKFKGGELPRLYEKAVLSINEWNDSNKEEQRGMVTSMYRQISDLYKHAYLLYLEAMYSQTFQNTTVNVKIPSLSSMVYTFLRKACNDSVVYTGEYLNQMPFAGRVMFVETVLRKTLFDLAIQRNNVRGISVARHTAPTALTDLQSHDMAVARPHQVPTASTPAGSTVNPMSMPSAHSSLMHDVFKEPSTVVTAAAAATASAVAATQAVAPPKRPTPVVPSLASGPDLPAAPKPEGTASLPAVPKKKEDTASLPAPPKPAKEELKPAKEEPKPAKEEPKPTKEEPKPTKEEAKPTKEEAKKAADLKELENIFELASQFTGRKPEGATLPKPKPMRGSDKEMEGKMDSLDLVPSEQDMPHHLEIQRILDAATGTMTPHESVSNIGGDQPTATGPPRKSVFMPP